MFVVRTSSASALSSKRTPSISSPAVRAALERLEEGTGTIACLYERIRDRLLAELERYLFRSFVMAVLLARR